MVLWNLYLKLFKEVSELSCGHAKCSFDINGKKTLTEVPIFLALTPERKKTIILTEFWFSTKRSFVEEESSFDKRAGNFWYIRKFWGQTYSQKVFDLFEKFFSTKMTLCTRRSQFWQPCRNFFPAKVRFFLLKVKKSLKSRTWFVYTIFSSKYSSVHVVDNLTNVPKFLLQSSQKIVAQIPKRCTKKLVKKQIRMVHWRRKTQLRQQCRKTLR